ncbi:pyridoxamine 5'-phosphate oxidase [Haloferax sp. Atlit-6N]|uniref:Pyridoxamine 5'-phosphate oxidase-like FMN-binding protein n=1 Tax=Haloferax gibbonsii (strain ATCC 33959 / DSM 4427 / JCM 8863 / NBRC 102184 / NCIMB 2188 / Ma 2.38) TaxID=1227459 RepID=M0GZK6_HALGM|nr:MULTISPECIES: pyridoxamine 5'-phosphate oxidase family protein [Haloferax]ELZ77660.1 pyridoxamine 5'-phosphate oxidase-like FMN- binding protein [Haloferax gibbonsii ATCC 33959]RDZ55611.1 pyridoxamine 5'-phosphate oxidase [Haloferax sp. Atlit-4N]REA04739.1 pyridoxamine 5'-phosphate oxidase [Haloferax sp. Atlit-6N]
MPDDAPPATTRDRPVTEPSYGIPESEAGLLEWRVVETAFADDEVFWVTTTRPDGRPHARPVWGVWVDGAFHCGGGERTRWVRNLARDPRLAVHTESGTDVVILEGVAERLDEETADDATLTRVDDAYEAKYGIRHGTPVFRIRPERVLAWSGFPADATRWRFDSA